MEGCLQYSSNPQRLLQRALGIALIGCAFALGLPGIAQAALLSLASASGSASTDISWNNDPFYGIDLDSTCYDGTAGSGSCVSVTAPGPLLGGYNYFAISVFPVTSTGPATLAFGSTYFEQYVLSPGSPANYGTVNFGTYSNGGTSPTVLSANVTGYSIYAANGGTTAQIELDLANAVIGAGFPGFTELDEPTSYLAITGTTSNPISIVDGQFTGSFELDWSAIVSTTPYAPVPLPATAWLLLSALGAFAMLRRSSRSPHFGSPHRQPGGSPFA